MFVRLINYILYYCQYNIIYNKKNYINIIVFGLNTIINSYNLSMNLMNPLILDTEEIV